MKPLVEKFGPDVIIFPNLFGQPLIDRWLYFEIFKNSPFANLDEPKFKEWLEKWQDFEQRKDKALDLEQKLTIANLPNRFLAVIPCNENLAKECEEKFRSKLKELAQKVYDEIIKSSSQSLNLNPNLKNDIKNHLLSYFQVYWVIMPWVSHSNNNYSPDDALNDYKELFSENDFYTTIKEIVEHPYYKPANVGSAYSLLLELTEKLLGARKSIRDFEVLEQPGEKCHLCGEFEILWFATDSSKWKTPDGKLKLDEKIKDWNNYKAKNDEIWENLSKSNKVFLKEGEKLCGVCLTKRLFPEIIKDELKLSYEIKFPSTSEMASIGEKRRLKEKLKEEFANSIFKPLKDKLERKRIFSISVPKLKGDPLYDIDGQFLMKETYREDYFKKEYGISVSSQEFDTILSFLSENKINPSKYYAILQMDGDNMGKWLKGEFNPKIENTIHSKVKDALIQFSEGKDKESLEKILCSKHPTSPSIHQAFSRKLSQFALEEVRKIVEDEHYGKLIYAGGDDVLAFLPIEEVLKCAYDLQKKFKEVLSPKASMSAGIVIVHHKYPLYLALEEVNNAEKRAKKHYGKNAFCLRFLSHGGEPRECGGNWELISFLEDLICKFKTDEISSVFPYQYLEVVEKLCERDKNKNIQNIKEILEIELKRIFMKKEGDKERLEDYFEKEILSRFKKIEDFEDFANMLVIARKISGEVRV
jgi:CRISPR-associated protein Cmr2